MGWFWQSKSDRQKSDGQKASAIELQNVQAEFAQLQAEVRAHGVARSELEQATVIERQQMSDRISDLTSQLKDFESKLAEEQKKSSVLDSANMTMAGMVRERERQIEENQKSSGRELLERDSKIQHYELQLRKSEAEIQTISSQSQRQIADLTQQNATFQQQIRELEKRAIADSSKATARIAELEQQLAASETRSANRAEQRSALLRNMAEIHKLSMVASKGETASEPLKILSPDWPSTSASRTQQIAAEPISANPLFSTWVNHSESESA